LIATCVLVFAAVSVILVVLAIVRRQAVERHSVGAGQYTAASTESEHGPSAAASKFSRPPVVALEPYDDRQREPIWNGL
jgi:hypothetical protein